VIASIGSEAYFREAQGGISDSLRVCREDRARNDRLFAFVEEVYEKLASLYATLPEDAEVRERLRREALEEARRSFARQFDARECGFAAEDLNDALLTRLHTFAHHRPLAFAAAASFERTDEAVSALIRLPTSEEHAARILRALAARGPALPSTPSAR
jgi:hypothetical protein